ncbi:hypothetical protein F2P56_014857 [Juglans regia]|uniref:Uncharacterized protein LOC109021088 n=2 Tax=Juglans regia TaxID=51240 RepID=A0A2I4HSR1_JUGRE|nr:uncharacterized protein LOC109021088 [Juglans regia]KAF5464806.1 hypothetical protein F2P56_014857 [Juglans regia]
MSLVTAEMKAKAEVYHGDELCREKFMLLLSEMGLPDGLLILEDIEECGYVKEIGFVWLKHKQKREYRFDNILVCYDTVVTAYFEPNKIKKLTGVKAKEFWIWITLNEIYVKDPPARWITFKTSAGLSKSFPISVFVGGDQEN